MIRHVVICAALSAATFLPISSVNAAIVDIACETPQANGTVHVDRYAIDYKKREVITGADHHPAQMSDAQVAWISNASADGTIVWSYKLDRIANLLAVHRSDGSADYEIKCKKDTLQF